MKTVYSFCYEENISVIKGINLSINATEKATFIGRTGVGKTTLFKLTMGLLKPTEGRISLNGIDVYQIPNEIKHRLFGYVDQLYTMCKLQLLLSCDGPHDLHVASS